MTSAYLELPLRSEAKARGDIAARKHAERVAKWRARIATDAADYMAEAAADAPYVGNDPTRYPVAPGQIESLAEDYAIEARARKIDEALEEILETVEMAAEETADSCGDPAVIRRQCDCIAEALDELRALADAVEGTKP